jgi:hypothetical protein
MNSNHQFSDALILHFGYHKCLTSFYQRLMQALSTEFGFAWRPFYDDTAKFRHAALNEPGNRVLLLTDRDDVQWDELPAFRGSHFIRDPRDLVVSGYFYHLWTKEAWCQSPNFAWSAIVGLPQFAQVEPDPSRWPRGVSYQAYLNRLDPERGMLLEMLSREGTFQQMRRWNFSNPRILEIRYEEFAGNEEASCARLFDHYGFGSRLRQRGLELARKFGLKSQAKKEKTHIRSGAVGQWAVNFPPAVKDEFKKAHGDLLVRLGYERNMDW